MCQISSESFDNLCKQNHVVFLSVGKNNIQEDIYDRTGEELKILYKRIVKKFNQIETAITTVAVYAKVVIATILLNDNILTRVTIRNYNSQSSAIFGALCN